MLNNTKWLYPKGLVPTQPDQLSFHLLCDYLAEGLQCGEIAGIEDRLSRLKGPFYVLL